MKYINILLGTALLLFSCNSDDAISTRTGSETAESEVTFTVQLPGSYAPAATRALTFADEYDVQTVEVLVFDNATGNFLYSVYVDDIEGTPGQNSRSFTVSLKMGSGFDIVLLTNSREFIKICLGDKISETSGLTRADIEQYLCVALPGKWDTDTDPSNTAYRPIPMFGEKRNVTIDETTSFTGSADRILLSRMLARIDVTVDSAVQGDYVLQEVYLFNHYYRGLVMPDTRTAGVWDAANNIALAPSLLPEWTHSGSSLRYNGAEVTATGCTYEIYTFEAPAGTTAGYLDNTCLVVGGLYMGEVSYYRLDFVSSASGSPQYLPLLRNHFYSVNIASIGGRGAASPGEAFESLPMNIEAEVTVKNDGEIGYFVYDGQYVLGADPHEAELWKREYTGLEIKVDSDNPNGWTYTVNDQPDGSGNTPSWLRVTSRTTNPIGATDILTYEADENTTGSDRTGYIILDAGRLTMPVEVVQRPWYIEAIEVSPTGEIPTVGDTRTVSIEGTFGNMPVRVWNATAGAELVTGIVPAATAAVSSTALTVPELWADGTHVIAFQYWHSAEQAWKVIRTEEQTGYHIDITSTHVDGDPIDGPGESFTVTVNGNRPTVQLRAWDVTNDLDATNSWLSTGPITAGTGTDTAILAVHPNLSYSGRQIELQWSIDGTVWNTISSGLQGGYNFSISTSHAENALIDPAGETFQVTISGYWPEVLVRGIIQGTTTVVTPVETISTGSGINTSHFISVELNDSWTSSRIIEHQYSIDNGINWEYISSGEQEILYNIHSASTDLSTLAQYANTFVTVSISGSFPANTVEVRAFSPTTNSSIASGFISNDILNSTGSVTLTIAPYNNWVQSRDVRMEYYHPGDGVWITVGPTVSQGEGYVITNAICNILTNTGNNATLTVTLTGRWPSTISVRAIISDAANGYATGTVAAQTDLDATTSVTSSIVTVGVNDTGADKVIPVRYQHPVNGWTEIMSFTQEPGEWMSAGWDTSSKPYTIHVNGRWTTTQEVRLVEYVSGDVVASVTLPVNPSQKSYLLTLDTTYPSSIVSEGQYVYLQYKSDPTSSTYNTLIYSVGIGRSVTMTYVQL